MQKYLSKIVLFIILIISSFFLIYNIIKFKNVSNFICFLAIFIIVIITFLFIYKIIKKDISFTYSVIIMSYALLLIVTGSFSNNLYSKFNKMNVSYNIKTMNIVKLKNNNSNSNLIGTISNDLDNLKNIKDLAGIDGEIITKNTYAELVNALYEEELNFIYIPSTYLDTISNNDLYPNIVSETEVVYTNYEKEEVVTPDIDVNKTPFSFLIMGVDSSSDSMINSSFNGDALLLFTFNPNTLKTTVLSIPRDTYTSITCFDDERKNKITHAAWYGENCMMSSIEKMFDIKIDYFIKINFKGFVSLIDLLGGIDVDVPITFCEQDSNRSFENQICLNEGENHLNGEEALALARHRKTINDFIRGDNQKLIAESIFNKIKDVNKIDTLYNIFDTISNNMVTNISSSDILKLFNIVKKKNDIEIVTLKLDGYDEYIYDYSYLNNQGMQMNLYNFVPYVESIRNIKLIMKQNLNGEELTGLNINNYTSDLVLLPNFVGRSIDEVEAFCKKYNINLIINDVVSHSSMDYEGKVVKQDINMAVDVLYLNELVIDVVKEVQEIKIEKVNCSKEEYKDNPKCQIPNFIGKDYSEFQKWLKNNNYSFRVIEEEIDKKNKKYDASKKGIIILQNNYDISIYDMIGKTLKISYIKKDAD